MKVKIDPEFAALIPSPPEADDAELERTILADGAIFEPFVVWANHHNTLLDGHRRHKITLKHPSLKVPPPVKMNFDSRQEAHDWIIHHQLAKRNVNEAQRKYLIGKLYRDNRLPVGRAKVDNVSTLESGKTAEKIAQSEGVTERTVRRSADFADAVDSVPDEVKKAVLSGEVKATTKQLEKLASLSKRDAKKATKAISSGEVGSVGAALDEVQIERDGCSDLSPEESMSLWNRNVESWAREIMGTFKNAPEGAWLDESRLNIVEQQLKSAAASARQAKCDKLCPLCNGDGCKRCHDTGFMPKRSYEMAGGK